MRIITNSRQFSQTLRYEILKNELSFPSRERTEQFLKAAIINIQKNAVSKPFTSYSCHCVSVPETKKKCLRVLWQCIAQSDGLKFFHSMFIPRGLNQVDYLYFSLANVFTGFVFVSLFVCFFPLEKKGGGAIFLLFSLITDMDNNRPVQCILEAYVHTDTLVDKCTLDVFRDVWIN